ncbi:CocE/NonD family hydrolase C-terminal non-catalytic domain-containing protein [Streptomyces sp. NPDC101455]|uniref:CocE/NonD family hydrolase C-terminal non-catalytic domain-containing protein n=1 Tax=Streptomyces sp. NPDC101455 TaxID=3366142 RepID=UPI00381C5C43
MTHTTAPLTKAALLNGPTDVTLYAKSTTPETELSAKPSIVAPDGTVTKQADGILLGSQRALDTQESWYGDNGTLLKPSHPFTQASQRPVTPGRTTRYDISLLSNFTRIPAGYRIRISINSQPPGRLPLPRRPDPAGTGEPGRRHLHRRAHPAGGVLRQPASDDAEFGHAQRHRLGTVLLNHEGAKHGWQVCAYGRPATPVSGRA